MFDINGNSIDNALQGKKILCIGDSFVKGHTLSNSQTWAYKLANRNGMTCYNYGVNGASIAKSTTQEYDSLAETLSSTISAVSAADYIVVFSGHNDGNASLHGGTAISIGNDTDSSNTTFKGALNIIIPALLTAYPTAKMLFVTPFNRSGIEKDYADAIIEMCGKYSVPVLDCNRRSGICLQNSAQETAYELSSSLHLNESGHERLSYVIEEQLKAI